jgi:hypothetical protein
LELLTVRHELRCSFNDRSPFSTNLLLKLRLVLKQRVNLIECARFLSAESIAEVTVACLVEKKCHLIIIKTLKCSLFSVLTGPQFCLYLKQSVGFLINLIYQLSDLVTDPLLLRFYSCLVLRCVGDCVHKLFACLNQLRVTRVAVCDFALQVLDVVLQKVAHAVTIAFAFLNCCKRIAADYFNV